MVSIAGITGNISGVIVGIISAVIFLVVGVTMGPTVIENFALINATSMENVTMGTILVLFAGYAPFFYYLAVVGGSIAVLVAAVKYAAPGK